MPKVPQDVPEFNTNVPGVSAPSSREFGRIGEATANLGETLENASLNIGIQLAQADAASQASNAFYSDKMASENKINELKIQSPDGFIRTDPTDPKSDIVKNDDGSQRTITQEYHTWADEQYQKSQKSMPNTLATDLYRQRALPYLSDRTALLQNDTLDMRVKSYELGLNMNVKKSGDQMATNPGSFAVGPSGPVNPANPGDMTGRTYVNLDSFYQTTNQHSLDRAQMIGTLYNGTDAKKGTFEDNQKLAYYRAQGLYVQIYGEKKQGDPNISSKVQAALDVVNGKDPASLYQSSLGKETLSSMMDPKQKEQELRRLEGLFPAAKAQDVSDFKDAWKNGNSAYKAGIVNPGQPSKSLSTDPMIPQLMHHIQTGDIKRGEGLDMLSDRMANSVEGQVKGAAWKNASPVAQDMMIEHSYHSILDQTQAAARGMGFEWSEDEGQLAANQAREKLLQMQANDVTAKKEDFAKYRLTPAPNGQYASHSAQAFAKVIPLQNMVDLQRPQNAKILQDFVQDNVNTAAVTAPSLGTPRVYMDMDSSKKWGNTLQNGSNTQTTWYNFKGLMAGYGKVGSNAVNQMVEDKSLPPTWALMANVRPGSVDPETGVKILSAVTADKSIEDQFKQYSESKGLRESDFMAGMDQSALKAWGQARLESNPTNKSNIDYTDAATKVVTNYAKELYNSSGGTMEPSDAFKQSYATIIGQYTTPTKSGAASGAVSSFFANHLGIGSLNSGAGVSNEPNVINGQPVSERDKVNIQTNMSKVLTPEGLKMLELDKPVGAQSEHWEESVSKDAWWSATTNSKGDMGYNLLHRVFEPSGVSTVVPLKKAGQVYFYPRDKATQDLSNTAFPVKSGKAQDMGRSPSSADTGEVYGSNEEGGSQPDVNAKGEPDWKKRYVKANGLDKENQGGTDKPTGFKYEYDKNGKRSVRILHE